MSELKLYVWEDVLTDYTSGVMFALASSVDEARDLISPGWTENEAAGWTRSDGGEIYRGTVQRDLAQEPKVITKPEGFQVWGGG